MVWCGVVSVSLDSRSDRSLGERERERDKSEVSEDEHHEKAVLSTERGDRKV